MCLSNACKTFILATSLILVLLHWKSIPKFMEKQFADSEAGLIQSGVKFAGLKGNQKICSGLYMVVDRGAEVVHPCLCSLLL
jgi:hypothetical protein